MLVLLLPEQPLPIGQMPENRFGAALKWPSADPAAAMNVPPEKLFGRFRHESV
jgi:hypothetical protein